MPRASRRRRRQRRRWLLAGAALVVLASVSTEVVLLTNKATSPSAGPIRARVGSSTAPRTTPKTITPKTILPSAGPTTVTDNFHRSDRSVAGDKSPVGGEYSVQFDAGHTNLIIRNNRVVRGNPTNFGPHGAPILILPTPRLPTEVSVSYVFTPGKGKKDSVVVGTCAKSFGESSVQFAVSPTGWTLFSPSRAGPGAAHRVSIVRIAKGDFAASLASDGRTVYTSMMRVDLAHSSVTIAYPGGSKTISNSAISRYWGKLIGVQIRRPNSDDGDAQITAIGLHLPKA